MAAEREPDVVAAVRDLARAAQAVLSLVEGQSASDVPLAAAPAPGTTWSRRMSTGQAATIIGVTEDALRGQIRARDPQRKGVVEFDGIQAVRCGRNYRVRLDRRWFDADE